MTATKILSTKVEHKASNFCKAKELSNIKRKEIALKSMSSKVKITELAKEEKVSRKFIYQQKDKALSGIDNVFSEKQETEEVLFTISVTKNWIKRVVIALILLCKGSYRGVKEFCFDIFGYEISLGSIHNIVSEAIKKSVEINAKEELSNIRVASIDELFQTGMPVLGGIDNESNYCFLLVNEEHRDGDTWGFHLLESVDKGFNPEYTIADFGKGLRAGQKIALGKVPCFGDIFHILQEGKRSLSILENIAYRSINEYDKVKKADKKGINNLSLSKEKLLEEYNIELYDIVNILINWLRNDVLCLIGPDFKTRSELYDFIVEELEKLNSKVIKKLCRTLKTQKVNLLMFSKKLDEYLKEIAEQYSISTFILYEMLKLETLNESNPQYWKLESKLRNNLKLQFHDIKEELTKALSKIHSASSPIENLNGRLRSYFSLRHQIGAKYLDLLRFFLNHHKFIRSRHSERVGKSPAELMTGVKHPHWLEMLGFKDKNQPISDILSTRKNDLLSIDSSKQFIVFKQNPLITAA